MRKVLSSIALLTVTFMGVAQVTVTNNQTVAWYVQNVLLGANVTVSNITYNGSAANANLTTVTSVGQLSNPANQIGITNGFIMATGDATLAAQTNNTGSGTSGNTNPQFTGNDPQLQSLVSGTQYDKCIVEFDFVPMGDTLRFNYVFASEEYPEYVCSQFNDVFGFFVSGPNPGGGNYTNFNVARVPTSLNPLAFSNYPVAINSINSGTAGSFGSTSTCNSQYPGWQTHNIYYVANVTNGPYQYDGRTIALPAVLPVICGQTYHIKLAIADLGDGNLDSGVILEAGSFASNGVSAVDAVAPGNVLLCTTDLTLDFFGATDPLYDHFWDFGDGVGTSILQNPSYTFLDTGYYEVAYTASVGTGACQVSETVYFDVTLSYPEQFNAEFDIPTIDPCDGLDSLLVSLAFTGTGADLVVWDMGNGDIISGQMNVDYYYTQQGSYTISMTAYDNNCGNQQTFTESFDYIATVTTANAVAPPDTAFCGPPPYNMNFTATSNTPQHYWDFGDGTGNSAQANPSYVYTAPGQYEIMYVAIDPTTCNIADTVYFNVDISQAEVLTAEFTLPTVAPCDTPDSILVSLQFTGTGADLVVWDMGNGDIISGQMNVDYYYTQQGSYTISMTAYDNNCGNQQTFTESFDYIATVTTANAVAPPDTAFCGPPPYNMNFTATSNTPQHYWDFGDGTGNSAQANPSYVYTAPGQYEIMYVAIDPTTCNIADTVYFNVDISQAEVLTAEFTLPTVAPCETPDSILVSLQFTGTGADLIEWDMGDGTTFTNVNSVDYYYTVQGSYPISMTASDFYCNVSETFTDTVHFYVSYSESQADVPEDIFLCATPLAVPFSAGPNPPPSSYWDFGDGTGTSTIHNPVYTYTSPGEYTVMYVAIDPTTCNIADTVYFTVSLELAQTFSASLNFNPPPPCGMDSMLVSLQFTGSGADSIVWNMGNGDVFEGTAIDYFYTVPGVYTVSMTAYDNVCDNIQTISNEVVFAGPIVSTANVPNVFTPNDDGDNDLLKILSIDGSSEYSMVIFNRWGMKVFETTDSSVSWDGTTRSGAKAADGVYFYEVRYTDICTTEEKIKTGYVHLYR